MMGSIHPIPSLHNVTDPLIYALNQTSMVVTWWIMAFCAVFCSLYAFRHLICSYIYRLYVILFV